MGSKRQQRVTRMVRSSMEVKNISGNCKASWFHHQVQTLSCLSDTSRLHPLNLDTSRPLIPPTSSRMGPRPATKSLYTANIEWKVRLISNRCRNRTVFLSQSSNSLHMCCHTLRTSRNTAWHILAKSPILQIITAMGTPIYIRSIICIRT